MQHFEQSLIARLGELGFLGMLVPEADDGLALDTRDATCSCSKRSRRPMRRRLCC